MYILGVYTPASHNVPQLAAESCKHHQQKTAHHESTNWRCWTNNYHLDQSMNASFDFLIWLPPPPNSNRDSHFELWIDCVQDSYHPVLHVSIQLYSKKNEFYFGDFIYLRELLFLWGKTLILLSHSFGPMSSILMTRGNTLEYSANDTCTKDSYLILIRNQYFRGLTQNWNYFQMKCVMIWKVDSKFDLFPTTDNTMWQYTDWLNLIHTRSINFPCACVENNIIGSGIKSLEALSYLYTSIEDFNALRR